MTARRPTRSPLWACLLALGCSGPPAPPVRQAVLRLDPAWSSLPWDDPEAQPEQLTISASFTLPEGDVGGSDLVLEGLWWSARVTINDLVLPAMTGGIAPARLAVGEALRSGANSLAITVQPPSVETRLEVGGGLASSQFTWARAGLRVPPRLELRPAVHLENLALVATAKAVRARAEVAQAPAGAAVRFDLALDGHIVQKLGQAPVADGLAVGPDTPWAGPRWALGAPSLVQLVATLTDADGQVLDTAAVRTGAQQVTAPPGGPAIDGVQSRLLAARMTVLARAAPLPDRIEQVLPGRPNAVEIHGEMLRDDWLALTDELGLPVLVIPRCIGRTRPGSFVGNAPVAAMRDQDARLVRAALAHPSVLMWVTEGNSPRAQGPMQVPALWTDALLEDPHHRPVVGQDYKGQVLQMRADGSTCDGGRCNGAWLVEVTRHGDESPGSWNQMADAFARAVSEGAIGGAIPMPSPKGIVGWAAAWAAMADTVGAPEWPRRERRAASTVEVTGLRPGTVAWLSAPGIATVGAVADAQGRAELSAWHEGGAEVRVGEETRPVVLVAGKWKGAIAVPSPVELRWR